VVVTRARAQASGLAATLRGLGADVIEAPAIRIEPRPPDSRAIAGILESVESYDLVCLTSTNAATLLLDALMAQGKDVRALAGATIAAIGPSTARELERLRLRVDIVPERSVAESLLEALAALEVEGKRVLVPGAADARDVLVKGLAARGAKVDRLALYETVGEPLDDRVREEVAAADYVTFTSGSSVTRFLEAAGGVPNGARIVSIGPVTSATARERGLEVHVEAARHDVDGLVEALVDDAEPTG
jgi:uroporphyrinogen III methyltransferase/synthase